MWPNNLQNHILMHLTVPRTIVLVVMTYVTALLFMYNSKLYTLRTHKTDIADEKPMKYILQWTPRLSPPFWLLGGRNFVFVKNKCVYTNCFITDNRYYFNKLSDFDALLFNGWDVVYLWPFQLPQTRSPKQKYIFAAMESADNYPACDKVLDGFFNWTWTYKLDSNFRWGYMTIYELKGNIVGPAIDMNWSAEFSPIMDDLRIKLSRKSKAAAWFVSHCWTKSGREAFVDELQTELRPYGLSVDIYGECGTLYCPDDDNNAVCFKLVEDDYFFYLSFENSICEDYVTEKLLTALNNYAIPVVFGGANYSRANDLAGYLMESAKRRSRTLSSNTSGLTNALSPYYEGVLSLFEGSLVIRN